MQARLLLPAAAVAIASSFSSFHTFHTDRCDTRVASCQPQGHFLPDEKSNNVAAPIEPLQLLQVHVLFRHGDRAPMPPKSSAADTAVSELWESRLQPLPPAAVLPPRKHTRGIEYPYGRLTRKGAREAEELGKRLRARYSALLPHPHELTSKEGVRGLQVRSTNFPRTYLSAFYLLRGILGSEEAASGIPIEIWDERDENLYGNDLCARGALLWGQAWRQLTHGQTNSDGQYTEVSWRKKYSDVRESIRAHLQLPAGRFPWLWAVDYLDCCQHHGDPLPPAVTPALIRKFRCEFAAEYSKVFGQREICRLAMGPLLHQLHEALLQGVGEAQAHAKQHAARASVGEGAGGGASPGKQVSARLLQQVLSATSSPPEVSPVRIALYSGHDATLMPLSAALGRPFTCWPGYSSSICIELWATPDRAAHFVRVLYDGEEVAMPQCPPTGNASWTDAGPWREQGSTLCPWSNFQQLLAYGMLSPEQHKVECRVQSPL